MNQHAAQRRFIAVFLAPALLFFTVFVALPAVRAILYSFQKWDGLTPATWAGLDNFQKLFGNSDLFRAALGHNLILLFGAGSLTMLLALTFAALLHRRVRGAALFRVAFFFPNVIASVAVALLWVLLYSTTGFGVINGFLAAVQSVVPGLNLELPVPFFDSKNVIYSMIPMIVWTSTGFYMVLFLAGMEGIPEEYYEAAELDGASPLAQFFHITLPMIREVLTVGLVFMVISILKFFDPIWVVENQRPAKDAHVLSTLLYQKTFSEYHIGEGAAVAVLQFLLVFAATLVSLRLSRRDRLEF
jgi:multiple sugar transport system permease protein